MKYLDLVNMAMTSYLGEDTVAAFTVASPSTSIQKIIANALPLTVESVLREHTWDSAAVWKKFDSDDESTDTEQANYTKVYNLPSDYVQIAEFPSDHSGLQHTPDSVEPLYQISGSKLYTNVSDITIRYIQMVTIDLSGSASDLTWDSHLNLYIARLFAYNACLGVTQDKTLFRELLVHLNEWRTEALYQEQRTHPPTILGRGEILRNAYYPPFVRI